MPNSNLRLETVRASLGRIWGTTALEVRLNLFSPAPWVIGLVLSAFGYLVVRTAPDDTSFALGWALSHDLGPLAEILLLFLAASLAYRPQRYDATELQDSKLVASEEIIFGRWLGMIAAVLVPLLLQYMVTMIGQRIHSKYPIVPLAYGFSWLQLMPSVLFLTTCAFCFVVLTRVLILGAGLAGLLWFVLYFGDAYYPSVFRVELSQNRWVFLGFTAAAVLLMLLGYKGRRRAKRAPLTYGLTAATALLFFATLLHAGWVALALPSKASAVATWQRLEQTRRQKGEPLPNFAWTDPGGHRVSLATLRGKPVLLVFFAPKDQGVTALLGRLAGLRREFGPERLGLVAICLSQDLNGAAEVARLAGPEVLHTLTLVTDWGQTVTGTFNARDPGSVASWALGVRQTPAAILLHSDGREMARNLPLDENGWPDLKLRLQAALSGQADEPAGNSPLQGLLS